MREQKYLILLLVLFLLSSCGKKQKNIFDFSTKKEIYKVSKFDLGFVKQVKVEKTKFGNKLTWSKFDFESKDQKVQFIGYNVYRLARSGILPKKPLNKRPITVCFFLDRKSLFKKRDVEFKDFLYTIVPVFDVDGNQVNGLLSSIVVVK